VRRTDAGKIRRRQFGHPGPRAVEVIDESDAIDESDGLYAPSGIKVIYTLNGVNAFETHGGSDAFDTHGSIDAPDTHGSTDAFVTLGGFDTPVSLDGRDAPRSARSCRRSSLARAGISRFVLSGGGNLPAAGSWILHLEGQECIARSAAGSAEEPPNGDFRTG